MGNYTKRLELRQKIKRASGVDLKDLERVATDAAIDARQGDDMITAQEALALPSATLTDDEKKQFQSALVLIEDYIRKNMEFWGCSFDVAAREMNQNVCKAVCIAMKADGWMINANLLSLPPTIEGAKPTPHHWAVSVFPEVEIYAEAGALPKPEVLLYH